MTTYYQGEHVTLHHGDCLEVMRTLPDNSVDSVVTDPPYGLEFMGREWDSFGGGRAQGSRGGAGDRGILPGYGRGGTSEDRFAFRQKSSRAFGEWCEQWATECLRVLKPGGHMLAFGGSRTWHRLACAVEDAGFEVRDSIAWMHGQGFPKSLDVSKAIDKAAGAEREVTGVRSNGTSNGSDALGAYNFRGRDVANGSNHLTRDLDVTAPATPDAERWQGWGTALKPAFEPVVVARKPLAGNTVANNVIEHGTGALNIDACRVGKGTSGRWPANVVLDESQAEVLDQQSGESKSVASVRKCAGTSAGNGETLNRYAINEDNAGGFNDSGGASRFFPTFRYEPKAPTSERPRVNGTAHPTVKPLDLMRWLVRLVTPPGGTVLEPFAGSGTTVEAAIIEGFRCVAIEREADYLPLVVSRIHRQRNPVEAIRLAGDDLGLLDFGA